MYHLQAVTPEQVIFDDEIIALTAPGEEGYLGVLTNHAPLLTALKAGTISMTDKNHKKHYYAISKGFLEVNLNKASIIAETIERIDPVKMGIDDGAFT